MTSAMKTCLNTTMATTKLLKTIKIKAHNAARPCNSFWASTGRALVNYLKMHIKISDSRCAHEHIHVLKATLSRHPSLPPHNSVVNKHGIGTQKTVIVLSTQKTVIRYSMSVWFISASGVMFVPSYHFEPVARLLNLFVICKITPLGEQFIRSKRCRQ